MEPNSGATLTDEAIFNWEYLESIGKQPNEGDVNFRDFANYKALKKRYIFEVTNWYQTPVTTEKSSEPKRDTSIK
jgi:hypothetical protein